jgi:hypothetical protein
MGLRTGVSFGHVPTSYPATGSLLLKGQAAMSTAISSQTTIYLEQDLGLCILLIFEPRHMFSLLKMHKLNLYF